MWNMIHLCYLYFGFRKKLIDKLEITEWFSRALDSTYVEIWDIRTRNTQE